jgi:hypothetical protein
MSDAAATMVEYEVIWPDGDVYANRHGETRLSFAEAKATARAIGGKWRTAPMPAAERAALDAAIAARLPWAGDDDYLPEF